MEKIKCCKCKEYKDLSMFSKGTGKYGFSMTCKNCSNIYAKEYREKNKEEINKKLREYFKKNKDIYTFINKKYYQENKEKVNLINKKWRINNKEKYNEYFRNKRKTDINYKISTNLRNKINKSLKHGRKSISTLELLGLSQEAFKIYFESKFTKGMTWGKFMNGEIHIDHIIPCSKFDLTDIEQQKQCFHYSNLQPLWKIDNLRKYNKIVNSQYCLTI